MEPDRFRNIRISHGLSVSGLAAYLRLKPSSERTIRAIEAGQTDKMTGPISLVMELLERREISPPAEFRKVR